MRALAAASLLALVACATAPRAAAPAGPREAAARFLDAVEGQRWDEAWALLSDRWRGRLTPERLAADRAAGGALAQDTLVRARLALEGAPIREAGAARFPIGGGRSLRLVEEGGAWRVDALE